MLIFDQALAVSPQGRDLMVRKVLGILLALLVPTPGLTAELNLRAMDRYTSDINRLAPKARALSVSQFSDVRPTDWAYQALARLVEHYGCVAGYPGGGFQGTQSISREQVAALLNACLDRISEPTDEFRRLMAEFAPELAMLRGRVDALEANLGELQATQFSTTTSLSGLATFVVGGNRFNGTEQGLVQAANHDYGATTFSYDLQLTLDTSFNGTDLLRTNLRGGNFADSSFGGAGPSSLSQLEIAFEEFCGVNFDCGNVLAVDRLFYQFPLQDLTFSFGARIGQDDMLAIWPSVYPAQTVLDVLTLGGAPAAYNKVLGAGAGVMWQKNGFAFSANYVAANAGDSDPSFGGIATVGSGSAGTVQFGYRNDRWGLAALYSRVQNGSDVIVYATNFALDSFAYPGSTAAFALGGFWQPLQPGWLPSISLGWGLNSTDYSSVEDHLSLVTISQSWSLGLQWLDVLTPGNSLGMAIGQPVFATGLSNGGPVDDGNYVWECWYNAQLSDQISVTPAIFYLSRPLGANTAVGESFRQIGALLKTSFRF